MMRDALLVYLNMISGFAVPLENRLSNMEFYRKFPLIDLLNEYGVAYDSYLGRKDEFTERQINIIEGLEMLVKNLPPEGDEFWSFASLSDPSWENIRVAFSSAVRELSERQ